MNLTDLGRGALESLRQTAPPGGAPAWEETCKNGPLQSCQRLWRRSGLAQWPEWSGTFGHGPPPHWSDLGACRDCPGPAFGWDERLLRIFVRFGKTLSSSIPRVGQILERSVLGTDPTKYQKTCGKKCGETDSSLRHSRSLQRRCTKLLHIVGAVKPRAGQPAPSPPPPSSAASGTAAPAATAARPLPQRLPPPAASSPCG